MSKRLITRFFLSPVGKVLINGLTYLTLPGDELPLINRWFYRGQYGKGRKAIWEGMSPLEGLLKEYVEGARAERPGSALDIGCGMGRNAFYLARHGWRVTGVDIYETAIAGCVKTGTALGLLERCEFIVGSTSTLSRMAGARFDLALDSYGPAGDLAPQHRKAYAEQVARLIRPGGIFLIYSYLNEEICRPFLGSFSIETRLDDGGFRNSGVAAGHWYALRRAAG